jgi:hypothetical protein
MKRRVENSGLRRHRPRKRFRFEYTSGSYSNIPKAERSFWRAFDEMEKEQDGYLDLVERFERYRGGEGVVRRRENFSG